jgi:hypothetical protein
VLIGGHSRGREDAGRDVALLFVDARSWERPEAARLPPGAGLHGHTTTPIGRSRLLVLFGARGGEASSCASVLSADGLRWAAVQPKGGAEPPARLGHAAAAVRERVFVFGGVTGEGRLLGDLWVLDLDASSWTQLAPLGAPPCARKGAALAGLVRGSGGAPLDAGAHQLTLGLPPPPRRSVDPAPNRSFDSSKPQRT